MEAYSRWQPVPGVATPCSDIELHVADEATVARLRFSRVKGASPRDLLVRFERGVVGCMSHEEFAHPEQADAQAGEVPCLGGPWSAYAFPLLRVHASRWLASFSDGQLLDERRAAASHYRLVSLDNTVDVLTTGAVAAEWVPAAV